MQSLVDIVAIVQVRIVDQSFPPNAGTRFFKINPHHNFQVFGQFLPECGQMPTIVQGSLHIMDGTRPHNDEESVVFIPQNISNAIAGLGDEGGCRFRNRQLMV
jgi:hypothetical protein